MINKEWYILHQSKKFGPFAKQQILEMLKNGSVLRSQKIWRDGLDEPVTSYDLFLESVNIEKVASQAKKTPGDSHGTDIIDISTSESKGEVKSVADQDYLLGDCPPPLPPIPLDDKARITKEIQEQKKALVLTPAEESEVGIHKEIADFKRLSGQEIESMPPLPPDIVRTKKRNENFFLTLKKSFYLLAALILLATFYIIGHDLYMVKFNGLFKRSNVVDIKDFAILKKANKQDKSKLAVALMSSKDTSSLILSSNFVYDSNIKMELVGDNSRLLSNERIELNTSAPLMAGQAHFTELNFTSGDKIYPGYYKVKISSSEEKRNLYWYDRFYEVPQRIVMEDISIFLGHLPIKIFKKRLKSFLRKRDKKEGQFSGDLKQKWATLGGIVKQLKDELLGLAKTPPTIWKTKVSSFEKRYTRVYGSFFTEFYLNNEQVQKRLEKSNIREKDKFDDHYLRLSVLAKQVGRKMVEFIEKSSAFRISPNAKSRLSLKNSIEKETSRFIKKTETGLSELEEIIKFDQN